MSHHTRGSADTKENTLLVLLAVAEIVAVCPLQATDLLRCQPSVFSYFVCKIS